MLIHSAPQTRRVRVRVPFLKAIGIVFAGDPDLDREQREELADRRHAQFIQRFRRRGDRRDRWFAELKAALPEDQQAALQALEAEWSDEAIAREEAAYRIGVLAERTRGCRACRAERRRTSRVFRDWFRWVQANPEDVATVERRAS